MASFQSRLVSEKELVRTKVRKWGTLARHMFDGKFVSTCVILVVKWFIMEKDIRVLWAYRRVSL